MGPQASKKGSLHLPITPAYRFLHKRRPQFRTGSWHFVRAHDLIALPTPVSTKLEGVLSTIFSTLMPFRDLRKRSKTLNYAPRILSTAYPWPDELR
jgi:hypothetical protein